jgi:hypothetical protein
VNCEADSFGDFFGCFYLDYFTIILCECFVLYIMTYCLGMWFYRFLDHLVLRFSFGSGSLLRHLEPFCLSYIKLILIFHERL